MKYQLVLQFRGDSIGDLDTIFALEDSLASILKSDVDGHDIGSGEANIFILTDYPENDFEVALPIIQDMGKMSSMTAAFRSVGKDAYKVIWPKDYLLQFSIK